MENKIIDFLNKQIKNDSSLVVGVSGGPDSMCLLSLLLKIRDDKNINIIVAHVNHKLRSESEQEAIMVKDFCKNNNVNFELYEINEFKTEKFSEEIARKKRYAFFEKLIDKYKASYLLTAHHGDDLIETILMRINRGSTLSGYIGIKDISKNNKYTILRPLLYTNKDEIMEYINKNNISYAIDESNNSCKYTRNKFRHEIVSKLKEQDKNISEKYLKFSKELASYEEFVNNYIVTNKFIEKDSINIELIKKESNFIKRKTIELLIKKIQSIDILDINDNTMNELISIINSHNKTLNLNNGYIASNNYGYFRIVKDEKCNEEYYILDGNLETKIFNFYYNNTEFDNSNNSICLSSKEIELPLIIRTVKNGDKIYVKNLKGSKKVNDIFIDSKIEKNKRINYLILTDSNNNILWVPNLKKSKFAKDKDDFYDIIVKCEAKENENECKNK